MTCQTIVINDKHVSFYCYQLNTLALDDLQAEDNDLRNVCWQVVDLPLYSAVEGNQVLDFNEEALKIMIAFLTNPTVAQEWDDRTGVFSWDILQSCELVDCTELGKLKLKEIII